MVKWCFFLASFFTEINCAAGAGGGEVELLAALLGPAVGGANRDNGSSTCAGIYY